MYCHVVQAIATEAYEAVEMVDDDTTAAAQADHQAAAV